MKSTKETAIEVRERIQNDVRNFTGGVVERGLRGAIIGSMNRYVTCSDYGDKNYYRRSVLAFLFGEESGELSTKKLTDDQWFALYQWVEPWKDEDENKWKTREGFPAEMVAVFHLVCVENAMREYKVEDPLFESDGQPSEIIRYLLEQGGEITDVQIEEKSLLANTKFGEFYEKRQQ